MSSKAYKFGEFLLKPDDFQLFHKLQRVPIKPKAFLVLKELVERYPDLVRRSTLLSVVWANTWVEPQNVDVQIAYLRSVLGRFSAEEFIKTEPTLGYTFVSAVTETDATIPEALTERSPESNTHRSLLSRDRKSWIGFARTIIDSHENRSPVDYPYAQLRTAVPMRATFGERPQYRYDVLELLQRNLTPRVLNFLVGEYGSGKSYICGKLAYRLAKDFAANPGGATYLPVILPLRQTTNLSSLDTLLQSTMTMLYGVRFALDSFLAAQQAGRLVLILDGLDEMVARTDLKDVQFHLSFLIESAFFAKTPIIITTRPNIIPSTAYYHRMDTAFNLYMLDALEESEVRTYLTQIRLADLAAVLSNGPGRLMSELTSRPLYLEMITKTKDRILSRPLTNMTLRTLYDDYFEYWYERELRNIGRAPADLPSTELKRVLSIISQKMSCAKKPYINQSVLEEVIRDYASPEGGSDFRELLTAARERLIITPDFTEDQMRFTFRHDSLRAYFYADYLANQIRSGKLVDEELFGLDQVNQDFLFAMAHSDPILSSLLDAMWQGSSDARKACARDVIGFLWRKKLNKIPDDAQMRWLCAVETEDERLLLVQNLASTVFPAQCDLAGCNMAGASLSDSLLKSVNLRGTVLTGASCCGALMNDAKMIETSISFVDFAGANLSGANFENLSGESPTFAECKLQRSTFTECNIQGATFARAQLTGARLRDCSFNSVSFEGADLRTSVFENCSFIKCDFKKALLEGAFFDGSCRFVESVGVDPL